MEDPNNHAVSSSITVCLLHSEPSEMPETVGTSQVGAQDSRSDSTNSPPLRGLRRPLMPGTALAPHSWHERA